MKVYRGYDKSVGPISYAHWTYVTPDPEQAKWYATKGGDVEDGAIIEYNLDVDNLRFISLDKLNSLAQSEDEIYSEEDLLWYQEGLGESLYKYVAGIVFQDPHYKDHTIYIVFSKENLKNGRIITPEEFDAIDLKESVYDKKIGEVLEAAGIQLDESVTPEQVPEKLYHATFSKLLRKIKKCGYLGNSPYKLWSDSNNKYVYLATDPDEAYSYAETALDDCDNERLYDMLEDDDIVILEIDTKYLDKNKLFRDENVVDGETTYQYEGIINCQIMKIYKPTLDESVFWKGEKINNYEQGYYPYENNNDYDKEDEMIVWKNPSAEWMKYQLDSGEYFRFCYISKTNELFVWYGENGFHRDTMDITGADGDVIGTMAKNHIDYWPDDDDSPKVGDMVFRQKRKEFLDIIYPNGYTTGVQY